MSKSLVITVLFSLFAIGLCADDNCYFQFATFNGTIPTPCIQMNVSSTVDVHYNSTGNSSTGNNSVTTSYKTLTVPCTSIVTGKCSNTTSTIYLTWGKLNDTDDDFAYNLEFVFMKNGKVWNISEISFTAETKAFENFTNPDHNDTVMASISKNIIGSPSQDRTYFCKSKNNLSLTTEEELKNQFNISVTLEDFKVKAFDFKANDTTETYGKVSRCSQDIKGSKIVPIAVGAALAGLVVIVLVAYIIGRLRSRRQSSYEALS